MNGVRLFPFAIANVSSTRAIPHQLRLKRSIMAHKRLQSCVKALPHSRRLGISSRSTTANGYLRRHWPKASSRNSQEHQGFCLAFLRQLYSIESSDKAHCIPHPTVQYGSRHGIWVKHVALNVRCTHGLSPTFGRAGVAGKARLPPSKDLTQSNGHTS